MAGIFERIRLRPEQLRTVAERRFDDAQYLRRSGENKHANGAMYLAGFVVELLLKAALLEKHPILQAARDPAGLDRGTRRLWQLVYQSHDLEELLAELNEITDRLSSREQSRSTRLTDSLKSVCAAWTIFARYSPHQARKRDAEDMLDTIRELKEPLKERLR
jgi:hypothetical protein